MLGLKRDDYGCLFFWWGINIRMEITNYEIELLKFIEYMVKSI